MYSITIRLDHEVGKNAAREYAVEHGYRIVSSNISMIFQKDTRTFDYRLDAGPLEFLNFVKYAKYCIGSPAPLSSQLPGKPDRNRIHTRL